jgi:hypothetical protein
MLLLDAPDKLVLPFADGGGRNAIPAASQIGITPGAASLEDGFPPLTRTPLAGGGVPPSGLDMNGILFEMSAVIRWANAGGGYPYDTTFANDANVGGYPKGARVLRSDGLGYWFNTVDDNVTDPESAGAVAAGWVPDFAYGAAAIAMTSANVTLTELEYGKPVIVITGLLTANLNLIFPDIIGEWLIFNGTTGAFNITAKTSGGTGVPINDTAQKIACNGVNVYSPSSYAPSVVGSHSNLKASADGVSANVSVSADEIIVESSDNAYQTLRNVALTIAGTAVGVNGIDAGAIGANTWYALWVIWNGTTVAGLMSLSATAPTLPAGYTHKARVGWIRTDGTGNAYPLSFKQVGASVQYVVTTGSNVPYYPIMASGVLGDATIPTFSAVPWAAFLPPTAVRGRFVATNGGGVGGITLSPSNNFGNLATLNTAPPLISYPAGYGAQDADWVLEGVNIYYTGTVTSNMVQATGWEDSL